MAKKRGGLGRGLESLFEDTAPSFESDNRIETLPLREIEPDPAQPRKTFDEETLAELAASISEHGLLQPIAVRPHGVDRYLIVAGERRWRACRMAGLTEAPVVVKDVTDEQAHEIGMELAREILGGRYEFVLTTHIDRDHVHNHLIFNAVSFADHKHYHSNKRSYHFIRRTSDRLCKEHGLSIIVPGQDKGKSYNEHQAERTGTSYKAKLRAAIDRLLPGCHDLEELLVRLQREGYALKRGKYISARAPGQERFTRLKTLGADYAEDALTARMAGRARPSRQPKQRGGRVSLLIDIQNNIKAQQSAGYRHWATIENLKRIAETSNFLTEHGIGSMEELTERCEAAAASAVRLKAELRETGARIEELTLKMKHVAAYRQLKPIYDRYQASKDKEKFLRGYEREIILFEAAARECKRLGAVPLPSAERMQAEMDALTARRAALTAERQKARREEQDYAAVRRNVEEFLSPPRQVPARQKDMELE